MGFERRHAPLRHLHDDTEFTQLRLTDGVVAPSTTTGQSLIYVDTADGDLKVKFGDGTTKVIAQDSAPAYTAPTLVNGWANYSGSSVFDVSGYIKDNFGIVHLKGLIQHVGTAPTADEVIFELPAGYRPLEILVCTCLAGGDGGTEGRVQRIDIHETGEVKYKTQIAVGAAGTWISLTGISFLAEL